MDKGFFLYWNYGKQIRMLDCEQCGRLLKALYAYGCGEKTPELDSMTDMLFSIISDQIARDRIKYERICKLRAEMGRKGGIASGKARAVSSCEANEAKASYNVNDNDN